ncbi:GIY-YIG nuclease family protein [Devosia submarina]|uniref:GIY-YIG nuclease family protein n=1 Tax=Devosia submarina TaxID=1173082 RepID=UPI000D377169|nr:GIY-YIG nuclease family protein [Devosia submarina]
MSALGRTVRLFLVDGNAQAGLITAEIINWTGRVLVAPRERLAELVRRPEADKTGVYILLGDAPDPSVRRTIYVGESDIVGRRIVQHSKDEQKDFFERVCLITSSDQNITKAHVRYLESRITQIARESGRAHVLNANDPPPGAMPESDLADMEFFLEQLKTVLPVLGFDILREPISRVVQPVFRNAATPIHSDVDRLELILRNSREGLSAAAVQIGDETIVREGSLARKDPDYAMNQYSGLRDQLIADGSLSLSSDQTMLAFTRDVPFSSPSAAAAVIYGRNANGRTSWLVKESDQTLKEYQDAMVEAASANIEAAE